jgi:tetratricopeptide (TPR) repeat protein
MEALLAALSHDPARTSRNWTALLALLALLVAAGVGLSRGQQRQRTECLGGGAKLAGIWEPPDRGTTSSPHKEAIRRAFLATSRPYAGDAFAVVSRALDGYTSAWRDMHRDVCEATHIRGEQSAEVLDLRMGCLDERLAEVRTLAAVFDHADADVVVRSVQAAQGLRPVAQCADVTALRAVVRPPEDPAARRRLAELRARLAATKAQVIAGRHRGAAKEVSQLVDDAEAANYAPIMAEALLQLGEVQLLNGEPAIAEKSYEEAIWLAEGARHDEAVLEAADQLIAITGFSLRRHQDGERWASFAGAVLRRLGPGHDLLKAWRANNLAMVYYDEDRIEDALRMFTDAVTIKTRALGERHFDVAISIANQASVLHELGRTDEALRKNRRTIDIFHETVGDSHPKMAEAWASGAEYLNASGRYTEAHVMARQAIAVAEREPEPNEGTLTIALIALGVSWLERGQATLAVAPLERALRAVDDKNLEPVQLGRARFALARALAATKGPPARVLALAVAARAAFESSPRHAAQRAAVDQWIEAQRRPPGRRAHAGPRRP